MPQRPKGCQPILMTADGVVSADPKNVYTLVIGYAGATAGDMVALRDGGPLGAIKVFCSIPAANGTLTVDLGRYGAEFLSSVYYTELCAAVGKIRTAVLVG